MRFFFIFSFEGAEGVAALGSKPLSERPAEVRILAQLRRAGPLRGPRKHRSCGGWKSEIQRSHRSKSSVESKLFVGICVEVAPPEQIMVGSKLFLLVFMLGD